MDHILLTTYIDIIFFFPSHPHPIRLRTQRYMSTTPLLTKLTTASPDSIRVETIWSSAEQREKPGTTAKMSPSVASGNHVVMCY